MTDRISVHRTTENAETVRKARDLAWVASLLIVLSPTGYILLLLAEQNPFDLVKSILFFIVPALLVMRLIVVAIQLGGNLNDHDFLARMEPWAYPPLYLASRLLGLVKNAD